jgi:ANTAR domain-containing protein/PAS domain-containing protein
MPNSLSRSATWSTEQAFDASSSPYLMLDRDLRIRAVNAAYQQATLQSAEALLDCYLFDAFPDNPDTPEAHSVNNLTRSLEAVLRLGQRDRMPLQRYDVPSPDGDGSFIFKVWSPTNSPLRDADGEVTGVLHHVEDVTAAFDFARPVTDGSSPSAADPVETMLAALRHEQQVTAELRDKNAHLQIALQTNRQIGAAVGIVMYSHRVTAEAAFDLLRQASQRTHRKLRDLAESVVEQGCIDF